MKGEIKKYGRPVVPGDDSYRRFDFRYAISALYPFEYHPDGHAVIDIGLGANWVVQRKGTTVILPSGDEFTSPGNPRFGSLSFLYKLEVGQDSETEKWRTRNNTISFQVTQDIPGTAIDLIGGFIEADRLSGNMPATVSLSFDRVFETAPGDSSYFRGLFSFNWGLQLVNGVYFYPTWKVTQLDERGAHSYFQGEFMKFFPSGFSLFGDKSGESFVFFARYISGRRPPEFVRVDEWDFGIAVKFSSL